MFYLTPHEVASELSSQITGKSICDLGCAHGDFLLTLLEHGAAEVSGIEMVTERAIIAQDRGLNVINDDSVTMPLSQIPVADMYYFYGDNLEQTTRIIKRVFDTPLPGVFVFGVNTSHYLLVDYFRLRGAQEYTVAAGHFKLFINNLP